MANTVVHIFLVFIVGTLEAFGSRGDCVNRWIKSRVLPPRLRHAAVCVQQRTSAELTASSLLVIQDCISAMEGAIYMQNIVLRYAFYPSQLSFVAVRSSNPCVCGKRPPHVHLSLSCSSDTIAACLENYMDLTKYFGIKVWVIHIQSTYFKYVFWHGFLHM